MWLPFLRHHGRVATYDFAAFDVRLGLRTHFCGWDDGWSPEGKLTIDHGKPPMMKCPPLDCGARDRRGDSYRDWLPSEPCWWKRALWPAWRVPVASHGAGNPHPRAHKEVSPTMCCGPCWSTRRRVLATARRTTLRQRLARLVCNSSAWRRALLRFFSGSLPPWSTTAPTRS